ncbi:MAG: thioredoxin [Deltaproteobacteria bacterium]|nr:thioredoxin [Deltaproteobacteria bacterium]
MSKAVIEINDSDFEAQVLKNDLLVLVDFWAPWCAPCRSIAPTLEEIANELSGKMIVAKVNVDQNKEYAEKYSVKGIPNLIFFKGGQPQQQIRGLISKQEILDVIKKLL